MNEKRLSILYVEDETNIRDALSRSLKRLTDSLYIAKDGREGLKLYKEYAPDLVVTDIKMPYLNGIEMAKAIRDVKPEQSIVFISAHSESIYLIEAIDMQVDGYILKPVNIDHLHSKINSIADTKRLKHEIERKNEQLIESEKMASLGKMIGNIAHQWRQPLAVISATIAHINIEKELGILNEEELILSCDKMSNTVQYLSDTINDFREYVKEDNLASEFILRDLIDALLNMLEPTNSNDIKTVLDIDPDIKMNGCKNHLKQALINIFYNIKDAFIDSKEDKYIFISAKDYSKGLEIIIKDNAGGIEQDIIHNIFEPYFTTKHKSQGTGLGLYMTYNFITKSFSGEIDVENETFRYNDKSYKGAKFTINLPRLIE